jgi:hypothetical protein
VHATIVVRIMHIVKYFVNQVTGHSSVEFMRSVDALKSNSDYLDAFSFELSFQ